MLLFLCFLPRHLCEHRYVGRGGSRTPRRLTSLKMCQFFPSGKYAPNIRDLLKLVGFDQNRYTDGHETNHKVALYFSPFQFYFKNILDKMNTICLSLNRFLVSEVTFMGKEGFCTLSFLTQCQNQIAEK